MTRRPTSEDFEREGLLDGVADEHEREQRLALLQQLADEGVELEELRRAVAEQRLALLPVDLLLRRDCTHTLREASELTGLDEGVLRRNYLALGLPVPDLDEPSLTDEDVEQLRMLKQLLDTGLPERNLIDLARVFGRGAHQTARAILEQFGDAFLHAGDTERAVALRWGELAQALLPTLQPLAARPLSLHLRELIRRQAISDTELHAGTLPDSRDVAVAFADLAGFTPLSERLSIEEVGRLVDRFADLAGDVAQPPVQLVKLIGDEAMLVATDAGALVAAAVGLRQRVEAEADLPPVRVGVAAGPALNRAGDWYGRTVNLASRLTEAAEPGTITASKALVSVTADEYDWEEQPPRRLKGIEGSVQVFRLTNPRTT